jgi:choline-sulfatase
MANDGHKLGSARARRGWWLLLGALGLPGCTTATAEGASQVEARHATRAEEIRPNTAHAAPAAAVKKPAHEQLFYDLEKHVDHAELRRGDALFINFGDSGDAKYTLGGWNTRVRGGVQLDGVDAALVSGAHGDFIVPIARTGATRLHLSLRAPRDGQVIVHFDGVVVARLKTDPNRFNVVTVDLPADKATAGEHMLKLQGTGMGRIGKESAAVALDWLVVASGDGEPVPPPSLVQLSAEAQGLRVPAGFSVGYAFRVPEKALFSAQLAGQRLQVSATLDDRTRVDLGEYGPGEVRVDLGQLAGKVVRLDLAAAADVTLKAPRVVIPMDQPPQAAAKPVRNVLIYLIDTLRADHLKPFNPGTRVRTPGLDQLVALGSAVFTSAHTQENWTKPSVATLLSSLMPWEHHAVTTEAVVPASIELLPELLQDRGFYTGAFIANGYVSDKFGFKQGWDTYRNYIREGRYSRAEFLAADVLNWLDKRPQKQPFFLYVHAIDPHVPYRPTKEFMALYDPEPYNGVVNFAGDPTLLEKIKAGRIKLNARDKVRLEALYDSEISYHDVHFRSVMQALETRGLIDDTMIVVVADHGEEFWDHGSVGHGHSVYEELLRIPMVVRVPGVTHKPVRITSSAGLVDVMPTVLEALGEPVPEGLSGRSMLPELYGRGPSAPPVAVSGFMDGWRTAVIADLKLIQRTERRFMVHDLSSDPGEQTDVAAERPITTRYLRGQLGLTLRASTAVARASASGKKPLKQENTTIDAETEAQLRALGYVGSSRR